MTSKFMLVKTSHSPEGLEDPLEIDADLDFKSQDYEALAEAVFRDIPWKNEIGPIEFQFTDAGLFIAFGIILTPDQVHALAVRALESGAVLLNADTAEIISLGQDLEGML